MKKTLFVLILSLLIISIIPSAARTFEIDFGDDSVWETIEETYIEGQQEKENGPIRTADGVCVGWFKPGNALEVLEKVDFGDGLVSATATTAAAYAEDYFKENMPDAVFEIRIDTYDGPIVATVQPTGSNAWRVTTDAECTITDIGKATKGEHTIFLVNKVGTPEGYLDGSASGCNFGILTLESSASEPTASPTPEPTEVPTSSPTPVVTVKPTATPAVKGDDTSSNIGLYLGIVAGVLVVIIVISIVVLKKKKK